MNILVLNHCTVRLFQEQGGLICLGAPQSRMVMETQVKALCAVRKETNGKSSFDTSSDPSLLSHPLLFHFSCKSYLSISQIVIDF